MGNSAQGSSILKKDKPTKKLLPKRWSAESSHSGQNRQYSHRSEKRGSIVLISKKNAEPTDQVYTSRGKRKGTQGDRWGAGSLGRNIKEKRFNVTPAPEGRGKEKALTSKNAGRRVEEKWDKRCLEFSRGRGNGQRNSRRVSN